MNALDRKVALITGAASGIGRGIALRFAAEGAQTIVADINEQRALEAVQEIEKSGGAAVQLHIDVSDRTSVDAAVNAAIDEFGHIDVLVANAGIADRAPFLEYPLEAWEKIIRVNLTGCFLCGQAAGRVMAKRGAGRIINLASVSGQQGGTGRAAYGASKAAVINLTQTMAIELAPHGITVNAIAPGPVQVERTSHSPAQRQAFLSRMAIKRYGAPGDIAAAAVFLASDDAAFITGHTLNVDGGFHAAGVIFDAGQGLQ